MNIWVRLNEVVNVANKLLFVFFLSLHRSTLAAPTSLLSLLRLATGGPHNHHHHLCNHQTVTSISHQTPPHHHLITTVPYPHRHAVAPHHHGFDKHYEIPVLAWLCKNLSFTWIKCWNTTEILEEELCNLILLWRVNVDLQGTDVQDFHVGGETVLGLEVQAVVVEVEGQEVELLMRATSKLVCNDDPLCLQERLNDIVEPRSKVAWAIGSRA